ncbi:AI-2E family transporter [Kocuria rhizophila]|uniref:AI-2E family transporter n=1 Tax=Kocuria rhizophila TaxID=72000 RepID=UPI000EE3EAF3|nr:AI-2E family transporter [Kocuria rhizophila]MDV5999675.1 AI-2E family transporter [Kocuria rhizophila]HAG62498.1 AI-2E family transporter [Kocuria sp.]
MSSSVPTSRPGSIPPGAPDVPSRPHPAEDPQDMVTAPVRIAAAWSWRVLLIVAGVGVVWWLLGHVTTVLIPVLLAALIAGPLSPAVRWLRARHFPSALAAITVELGLILVVLGLLVLSGQQIVVGFAQLSDKAVAGFQKLLGMLEDSPLKLTTDSMSQWFSELGNTLQENSNAILSGAMTFGSTAGSILTGTILMLFVLLFFLFDGENIWLFLVKLFPRRARAAVNGAGRRGWISLAQYVRIQVFVAFVDALGIGLGAFLLGVPLALPIGVLVFLASFIPIVGAVVTGAVAVLVALVAVSPGIALAMLGVVLLVQQIESNILQPLIMGKAVSLHPVAVLLAVATGSMLFGIVGALFAVPVMAFANTIVRYLAARSWEHDDQIAWEPFLYPWEIKKTAKKKNLTPDQVMAQLQRFRGKRHQEREDAEKKLEEKHRKDTRHRESSGHLEDTRH